MYIVLKETNKLVKELLEKGSQCSILTNCSMEEEIIVVEIYFIEKQKVSKLLWTVATHYLL